MEFSAAYVKKVAETVETLRQITNKTSEKTQTKICSISKEINKTLTDVLFENVS